VPPTGVAVVTVRRRLISIASCSLRELAELAEPVVIFVGVDFTAGETFTENLPRRR
jgi:hypothetical protein